MAAVNSGHAGDGLGLQKGYKQNLCQSQIHKKYRVFSICCTSVVIWTQPIPSWNNKIGENLTIFGKLPGAFSILEKWNCESLKRIGVPFGSFGRRMNFPRCLDLPIYEGHLIRRLVLRKTAIYPDIWLLEGTAAACLVSGRLFVSV